jgi:hypothetical protein
MTLITDPDNLQDSVLDNGSTNLFIDTANLTIKLNPNVGLLIAADGVIIKAVYSFIKEEWKNDPNGKNLAAFDFPLVPITDEFFELVNGWTWADTTTEQTIRRGGWLVRNLAGGITEHWVGTAILNAEEDDQIYYDLGIGAVDYTFPGNTAEAIQVISDPNGDGTYSGGYDRSSNINVYNREQGQLYSSSSSIGIGESSLLAPKLFSFSLPTGEDLNISASDADIQNNAPYTGMEIRFYPSPQSRTIGGVPYDFGVIIDGNNGSTKQIYEFIQYQLRQNSDIDVDSGPDIIGKLTEQLLQFVGPNLETLNVNNPDGGGSGVYIDNFSSLDVNNISFTNNNGDEVTFPFIAGLLINNNLDDDPDAVYRAFFEDGVDLQFRYGQPGALLVEDNSGNAISGNISGNPSISRDFDYDGNNQGNRTPGTDANIIVIGIGLDDRQYVKGKGTITRTSVNTIALTSSTERQYQNPL